MHTFAIQQIYIHMISEHIRKSDGKSFYEMSTIPLFPLVENVDGIDFHPFYLEFELSMKENRINAVNRLHFNAMKCKQTPSASH